MDEKKDYDLTCWYLNIRRLTELLSASGFVDRRETRSASDLGNDVLLRAAILADYKNAVIEWMRLNQPPTLGQLLLSETVASGKIFTHYSNFYCKGLGAYRNQKSWQPHNPPEIYSKLDDLAPGALLRIQYHPEHLTAESAWTFLSGQRALFVLAAIREVHDGTISAIPYVIGTMLLGGGKTSVKGRRWANRFEVFVDGIDSFALVRNEPHPKKSELSLLKDIPEESIKRAFAEIIGEPNVPKDWGGEASDLFSANVMLDGERISTAFAFKGPAKFRPMRMAELGKNGDQIHRLFSEPADLLVLQHCHEITPPVRAAMRAYATNIGNPRLFSLINGYDTLRVLRAYGKCGFSPIVGSGAAEGRGK
jgi:hypothetical protein